MVYNRIPMDFRNETIIVERFANLSAMQNNCMPPSLRWAAMSMLLSSCMSNRYVFMFPGR